MSSCEICGWSAALVSMLAFGTFGVPIKSDVARSVDIDPLVFQTYKTTMCFLTSWLLLLHPEVQIQFTWWGVVSGLFWVPGGWGTVFAVKTAGLAVGIGVGSSFIVLVSFVWGIFIFEERVNSLQGACAAVGFMIFGILGMAYYSSSSSSPLQQQQQGGAERLEGGGGDLLTNSTNVVTSSSTIACGSRSVGSRISGVSPCASLTRLAPSSTGSKALYRGLSKKDDDHPSRENDDYYVDEHADNNNNHETPFEVEPQFVPPSPRLLHVSPELAATAEEDAVLSIMEDQPQIMNGVISGGDGTIPRRDNGTTTTMVLFGRTLPLRTVGIIAAVLNGSWGGSIMVPMHFAPPNAKGMAYVISFGIGAAIVNLVLWMIRYGVGVVQCNGNFKQAYRALPSFHFRKMWCAGGTSGLLWSIGNFCSLLSVEFLGEGVGYSVIQSAMLVSGLWGIFYFQEIVGWATISKWLLSAAFTVGGILLLSYEHHVDDDSSGDAL